MVASFGFNRTPKGFQFAMFVDLCYCFFVFFVSGLFVCVPYTYIYIYIYMIGLVIYLCIC